MTLAIIIAAIWVTSFGITELLFALYEVWRKRQLAQRETSEMLSAKRS